MTIRTFAALLCIGLIGACAKGGPADTLQADPISGTNETLAGQTMATDPLAPGATNDLTGTEVP